MGKGGKHLQNASQEIKELQEYNHELHNQIDMKDKLIETLEWKLIQNQNIIDQMDDTIQSTNDPRDEIEMKDQLIDSLQIKLREKKN
jgi:predicted RNase H-like nuclease (RuvC/YqgF family)